MGMENLDIRLLIDKNGIQYKQIADHLHITQEYMSRLMRYKLKEKDRNRILDAVKEIKKGINNCPFCGGEAEVKTVTRHIENNLIVVKCSMCGASTKTFNENEKENCINAWNRRIYS